MRAVTVRVSPPVGTETAIRPVSCRFAQQLGQRRPVVNATAEAILGAAETRLPDPVPLHPAARPACPRRRRQGPGDPCPAPPPHRPPTKGPTTQAGTSRPCPARRDQPRPAPSLLVPASSSRHRRCCAGIGSDRRGLDRSPSCIGPAAAGCRRPATDHRPGQGEPALGLPAHQGRAPFTGEHPIAVALAHLLQPPPPLPTEIPEQLRGLVAQAMAKQPTRRPPDASIFGHQLLSLRKALSTPELDAGESGWSRLRQGRPADRSATTANLGHGSRGRVVGRSRPAA
jgi:hypothetical protein